MLLMRAGDLAFFYHSNAKPSGIVGICRVVNEAHIDETAFDEKDPYYDPKCKSYGREGAKWKCVDVEFVREFKSVVSLGEIKEAAGKGGPLEGMELVKLGRLSVCKVKMEEWDFVMKLVDEREGKQKEDK